jgi:hypothetical protein
MTWLLGTIIYLFFLVVILRFFAGADTGDEE